MRIPLHHLLLEVQAAVAIWFVLVGLALTGCLLLLAPAARRYARRRRRRAEQVRARLASLAAQAHELSRYADEVATEAARAGATVQRRHSDWEAVCRARDSAWQAYLAADARASRATSAAAYPVPGADGSDSFVRRAATQAYRRGDLSVGQLTRMLSGERPYRHPADLEIALHRAARDRRRAAYLSVTELEAAARRAAEVALAAEQSLRREARAAAVRAHRFRESLTRPAVQRTAPVRPPARRASLPRRATATRPS